MAMLKISEISIEEISVSVVLLGQPKPVTFPNPLSVTPDVIDEPARCA